MFTVSPGLNIPGNGTYEIRRAGVYSDDTLDDFIRKVETGR